MSSFIRNIQRKALRRKADYEPAPQPFVTLPCGGYRTLRPTKGWATFTARRLRGERMTAALLGGR